MKFSYSIVADTCEGIGDCIPVCPAECIHWAKGRTNAKGTAYVYIDAEPCINCGACLSACPIEGAIQDRWLPEYQRPPTPALAYRRFRPEWRTDTVAAIAARLLEDGSPVTLAVLADALQDAGCDDSKLLTYCRGGQTCSGGRWVADLILEVTPTENGTDR